MDPIPLVVRESLPPFILNQNTNASPFVLKEPTSTQTINLTVLPQLVGTVDLTGPVGQTGPQLKGISVFCSGKPGGSEMIGGGVTPYPFTINQANCLAKAKVAATAEKIFILKREETIIGQIQFNIGELSGIVTITSTEVLINDYITITAPAIQDISLSDLSFIIRE